MRLFTTLSIQIMSVSVQYFVYELTNSALMLGYIGLVEAVPAIGVSLYAGHLADKTNRRNIISVCLMVLLLCACGLYYVAHQRGHWPDSWILTGIYCLIFLTGIARGFFSPTYFAFIPQLVDKKTLPNAISWNSSTWEVASISGLGLGGLLYGFGHGPNMAFGVMVLLLVIGLSSALQITNHPAPVSDIHEPVLARIKEGLRFVFSSQLILAAIALDLFAVLFGGAVALLPIFAKDILKVGPEGLGLLRAAMALGAITMAFILAHRPVNRGAGKLMLACVAGFGLCIIGFALSTWFWLSFFFLYMAGVMDEISVFIRASLLQHLTPDHMKGRVSSVNSIFITSSNEIGAFESGFAASLMGTVPSVIFGGCMTILVVGMAWWKAPKLRQMDMEDLSAPH